MKRSEINQIMRSSEAFICQNGFHLPPFARWSPQEWRRKGVEVSEIVENHLGWDITDFGSGNFARCGLSLFTLRNGSLQSLKNQQGKLYAEKIMVSGDHQITPLHFHWSKTEDIINRGGGILAFRLYNATPNESPDTVSPVTLSSDGMLRTAVAGGIIRLEPGESLTLPPYCYHEFWGEGGQVLVGEVSMVNDDENDNRFYNAPRFPDIEEDEAPLYLMSTDYEKYYATA